MRIVVWADMVCPWSYVGKRRLDRALERWHAEGGEPVEVRWLPYRVDPTAPDTPEPLAEVLDTPMAEEIALRCGGGSTATAVRQRVADIALAEGLGPPWGAAWRVNSFDAHRLLALAHERGAPGTQHQLAERLLRAHFVERRVISDRDVLLSLADEVGLGDLGAAMDAGEGAEQVRTALLRGKARGVATSPTFVVGRRAVAGAQPVEALLDLLRQPVEPVAVTGPVADFREAEALLALNDPLGALRLLRPLLDEHGDDRAVRLLAARAYLASAQLNRAAATLEGLVAQDPADDYARFLLGRSAERRGRSEEALRHYRVAVALAPRPEYAEAAARARAEV
ncbi:putative dithiol-disulfide isomerase, DsbA family [Streptoalloteichus tenebrarius]|uniref:Dithiol-disulfide isomerase, DsbA family n=1 Tax=Streptoalloteichus tenebrarius (strain ATCC 17920 / DSM 40477 / JCM 4838 / CBS 697.72 / NBRC 16177 / NCIMB 11028 / NRRL B-12390 / A12253. 1 / ISP 5477) TaxID=1933 RepID=A0ABT1HV66_STRSD|nr:DsbA family protein [Streptoalloteichus tenebrarius]MCP2259404.1 putative dithiol-disulfide isomerase, DsbA family [Streptoalloteichus tenebrarius]